MAAMGQTVSPIGGSYSKGVVCLGSASMRGL